MAMSLDAAAEAFREAIRQTVIARRKPDEFRRSDRLAGLEGEVGPVRHRASSTGRP